MPCAKKFRIALPSGPVSRSTSARICAKPLSTTSRTSGCEDAAAWLLSMPSASSTVADDLDIGIAHGGKDFLPVPPASRALVAPAANPASTRSMIRSQQAVNSAVLVGYRRNRYACEIPGSVRDLNRRRAVEALLGKDPPRDLRDSDPPLLRGDSARATLGRLGELIHVRRVLSVARPIVRRGKRAVTTAVWGSRRCRSEGGASAKRLGRPLARRRGPHGSARCRGWPTAAGEGVVDLAAGNRSSAGRASVTDRDRKPV